MCFQKHARSDTAAADEGAAKHLLLFSSSETVSYHDEAVAALTEAYSSYKGDLINVVVDYAKLDVTGRIVEAFDITEADLPCLRGFDVAANRKVTFEEPFEPKAGYIEDMAMQFLEGKAKGKVAQSRSDDPPPVEELTDPGEQK